MGRRVCSREFKLEAVKLVQERGMGLGQAARDRESAQRDSTPTRSSA